jgi:isoleucyl-tRNA synthetase
MGGPACSPFSAPELDRVYDPATVEGPTYQRWMELGVFEADPTSGRPPFTIVIPPPNVTGSLHLGHASATITLTVHQHVHPGMGRQAADRFAALLRG